MTPLEGDRVFLVGGQSNSVADEGFFAGANDTGIPSGDIVNLSAWNGDRGAWERVIDTDTGGGEGATNTVGQWFGRFAQKSLADGDVSRLFYIGFGVNGANLNHFLPGNSNYANTVTKVAASGATVTDIGFFQGESDVGVTKEAHRTRLDSLKAGWNSDYPGAHIWAFLPDRTGFDMTGARAALQEWAADNADVTLINIDDLIGGPGHDGTHFGYEDGYKVIGERLNAVVFP